MIMPTTASLDGSTHPPGGKSKPRATSDVSASSNSILKSVATVRNLKKLFAPKKRSDVFRKSFFDSLGVTHVVSVEEKKKKKKKRVKVRLPGFTLRKARKPGKPGKDSSGKGPASPKQDQDASPAVGDGGAGADTRTTTGGDDGGAAPGGSSSLEDLKRFFKRVKSADRESKYKHLQWEAHSALAPHECYSCSTIMPGSIKKGLRHHCRKCGRVVCTKCISLHKQKLKLLVDRDNSVKKWKEPTGLVEPPAQAVCTRCYETSMREIRKAQKVAKRHPNVFCTMCHLPCPQKAVADSLQFDTSAVLVPEDELGNVPVDQGGVRLGATKFLCRFCQHARPDRRGGLTLYPVLVSDLDPTIEVEDVHAAFEDRFGYVHDVYVPEDEDGFKELDKVRYRAHAIVRFFNPGAFRPPTLDAPHGVALGFEGALGAGACNIPGQGVRRGKEEDKALIHRLQWSGTKFQTVVPCVIREDTSLFEKDRKPLSFSDSLYADQRHLTSARRDNEWNARFAIDVHAQKRARQDYERKVHQSLFPAFDAVATCGIPPGQRNAPNIAFTAVRTGDLPTLAQVWDSVRLSSEMSPDGAPSFDPYQERFVGGQSLLHAAALTGGLAVVAFLTSDSFVSDVVEIMERGDRYRAKIGGDEEEGGRDEEGGGHRDGGGGDEATQLLSEKDLNVLSSSLNALDAHGNTPMHMAALSGNVDVFLYMLAKGGSAAAIGFSGKTCFHFAASRGHTELCKRLLAVMPYQLLAHLDHDNATALVCAKANGRDETVREVGKAMEAMRPGFQ
jgi:hypothetical protein